MAASEEELPVAVAVAAAEAVISEAAVEPEVTLAMRVVVAVEALPF